MMPRNTASVRIGGTGRVPEVPIHRRPGQRRPAGRRTPVDIAPQHLTDDWPWVVDGAGLISQQYYLNRAQSRCKANRA